MDSPTTPRVSERLTIQRSTSDQKTLTFAEDVRAGFEASPKRLMSPKWLYDDLGSALFDAICRLPEYDLTRVEGALLAENATNILASFDEPLDLFELGSGSSVKTLHVIDALFARQAHVQYHPIDISEDALITASLHLVNRYPALEVFAHAGDYYTVLAKGTLRRAQRALVMFLGSNIGNYEPAEAAKLLRAIGNAIEPGDGILLGVDLKKEPATLISAYDDPTGVTAAFIKNILGRMNRELGANFDLRAFTHHVDYDESTGAVTSYLAAQSAQNVDVRDLSIAYTFAAGERIYIESSYKFSVKDLSELARIGGFSLKASWTDADARFCEALLIRV